MQPAPGCRRPSQWSLPPSKRWWMLYGQCGASGPPSMTISTPPPWRSASTPWRTSSLFTSVWSGCCLQVYWCSSPISSLRSSEDVWEEGRGWHVGDEPNRAWDWSWTGERQTRGDFYMLSTRQAHREGAGVFQQRRRWRGDGSCLYADRCSTWTEICLTLQCPLFPKPGLGKTHYGSCVLSVMFCLCKRWSYTVWLFHKARYRQF